VWILDWVPLALGEREFISSAILVVASWRSRAALLAARLSLTSRCIVERVGHGLGRRKEAVM
jgi:hypothetical protein